jgi:hypothetical protein
MVTPKAMEAGSATSMAANPPQKSPSLIQLLEEFGHCPPHTNYLLCGDVTANCRNMPTTGHQIMNQRKNQGLLWQNRESYGPLKK